jgi:hypothetical protein
MHITRTCSYALDYMHIDMKGLSLDADYVHFTIIHDKGVHFTIIHAKGEFVLNRTKSGTNIECIFINTVSILL